MAEQGKVQAYLTKPISELNRDELLEYDADLQALKEKVSERMRELGWQPTPPSWSFAVRGSGPTLPSWTLAERRNGGTNPPGAKRPSI